MNPSLISNESANCVRSVLFPIPGSPLNKYTPPLTKPPFNASFISFSLIDIFFVEEKFPAL